MEDSGERCSSKLGSQEFWEETFVRESKNFSEAVETGTHDDMIDCGEVWFGERVLEKVVNFMMDHGIASDAPILDLGCGNGNFLLKATEEGYTNFTAVDYCQSAVNLAQEQCKHFLKEKADTITFKVEDIRCNTEDTARKFLLIHDKGTLDAFLLCKENDPNEYVKGVHHRLQKNDKSRLLITSCNWTREELNNYFKEYLEEVDYIKDHKSFSFGGSSGSTVT
eukprot:CAMPEP_0115001446 /NCGR_PEP_ID=MMETSP0216-20121206/17382_1 /TAXON_ID=223996 /ORGANISM="Protocruzia adherens, Strain Boccale" /LENGTH=222 /DNA_ID=CAMNT_0002366785 /DNA_START=57 /DNA_END=721 /DNA_ORIENTATION=+